MCGIAYLRRLTISLSFSLSKIIESLLHPVRMPDCWSSKCFGDLSCGCTLSLLHESLQISHCRTLSECLARWCSCFGDPLYLIMTSPTGNWTTIQRSSHMQSKGSVFISHVVDPENWSRSWTDRQLCRLMPYQLNYPDHLY